MGTRQLWLRSRGHDGVKCLSSSDVVAAVDNHVDVLTDLVTSGAVDADGSSGDLNTLDASVVTPGGTFSSVFCPLIFFLGIRVKNTLQLDHPTLNNIFVAGDAVRTN